MRTGLEKDFRTRINNHGFATGINRGTDFTNKTYNIMATEVAKARSNDFKVKDEAAFRAWAASRDLSVWEDARRGYFSIYVDYPRLSDGWPHNVYNEETGESIDVDVPTELAAHLQDGSVAVLMQSGSMGFQCISGYAIAINSRGESVDLRLLDIYEMAEQRQLGADIQSI